MQYSFACTALVALASSTLVLGGQPLQEDPNGAVLLPSPPPPDVQPAPPPNPAVQEKVFNPDPATPSATPTSYNPPPPSSPGGGTNPTDGQVCINFSGGDFHWANAGSWGTATGQGAKTASQCFGSIPGGAMFICEGPCNAAGDAAPSKYTKLECNFEGQYQNCDISLVDGYSLPLQCDIPNANPPRIGGLVDLDSLAACDVAGGDHTCNNSKGYAATTGEVSTYFQNANWPDGGEQGQAGNYCIWQFCSGKSDSFWTGKPTISCEVGARSHAKRSLETGGLEPRGAAVEIEALNAQHAKRHVGGAHAHAAAHMRK